ncbi:MAG: hypothetical protein M4D80_33985 [Myxococcota bacterium]|nr:hypothetical protein [Deltaproteobacteria bacterium]MDQ3340195.1 hypothetical protein [Myxococcota bacterium]
MRAVFTTLLFATACAPEIAPGSYVCGPEELCPEGQRCNRETAVCVLPSNAAAFACGERNADVPSNETPATAQSIGDLACVSVVAEARSCLPAGDVGDFYTFRVVDGCASARLRASVVFPIAFQRLVLQLGKEGEAPMTIDSQCAGNRSLDDGDDVACLDAPVSSGTYVIGVVPDGTGTCDNECRFNRYALGLQVTTL